MENKVRHEIQFAGRIVAAVVYLLQVEAHDILSPALIAAGIERAGPENPAQHVPLRADHEVPVPVIESGAEHLEGQVVKISPVCAVPGSVMDEGQRGQADMDLPVAPRTVIALRLPLLP